LYGAGAPSSLNQNRIFATWLQKKVVFTATSGTTIGTSGNQSCGPDRQQVATSAIQSIGTGRFSVYDTDGVSLLYVSPVLTLRKGDVWQYRGPGNAAEPAPIVATPTRLVAAGSVWKYLDTGTNLGTSWRSNSFDDTSWASGPAPLGYGEMNVGQWPRTTNSFGPDPNNKYITTYYRRLLDVPNAAQFSALEFRLLRDDGAVVYLNGAEVFRSNMPTGAVDSLTLATNGVTGAEETAWFTNAVNPALLLPGNNLLAVEIHQVLPTSSDLAFDLELTGTVSSVSQPTLNFSWFGSGLALTWPAAAGFFTLYNATNLAPPAWTRVTNEPVLSNGVWLVPLPAATNGARFYRLQNQ
jgi:hypothetical protein